MAAEQAIPATLVSEPNAHKLFTVEGVNNYLIPCPHGGGFLLVDTCWPDFFGCKFREGVSSAFSLPSSSSSWDDIKKLQQIRAVLITHAHSDHCGCVGPFIANANDVPIICSEPAVDILKAGQVEMRGRMPSMLTRFLGIFTGFRTGQVLKFPAVKPDAKFIAGVEAANAFIKTELGIDGRLIETPGHTLHCVSLLMSDGRCFCGDACMNIYGSIFNHLPFFIESDEKLRQTWDVLRSSVSILLPGHGPAFPIDQLPPNSII